MALQSKHINKPIGLIAGWGEFPFLVAHTLNTMGHQVIAVAFPEETYTDLEKTVEQIHWISIGQLGKMIKIFKSHGVQQAVMAGMITHKRLFLNLKLDLKAIALLARVKDKRADTLLNAVADALAKEGIDLISPLPFLESSLPAKGFVAKRRPSKNELADITFGYQIAKHIAQADIGQTVVIRNQAIVAVEAMEGTDACILRSGELTKGGASVIKVLKPKQDLRFDTPVIGPTTIESMIKAKATALAFDGGKTLFIQKEKTIQLANQAKIAIIAL